MELLIAGAKALQITLQPEHLTAFRTYDETLREWNARFNLTAITDTEGVQVRHFLDSLSCLHALEASAPLGTCRLIDVGTGAGFPGLPLKILRPQLRLTLVEATEKKTRFLQHIVEQLQLREVQVLHARAEELGQDPAHRERYDWVVARAVAEMPILMEYLLPLAKLGGRVLAQKGESAPAEVQGGEYAITQLGGRVQRIAPVELRGLAETRYLVVVAKVAATPDKYPRRAGMPAKRPLCANEG